MSEYAFASTDTDFPFTGKLIIPGVPVPPITPSGSSDVQITQGLWKPVFGGALGESGQAYHQQYGTWVRTANAAGNGTVNARATIQFENKGTFTRNEAGDPVAVILRGLPFPTANVSGGYFDTKITYASALAGPPKASWSIAGLFLKTSSTYTHAEVFVQYSSDGLWLNPVPFLDWQFNNTSQFQFTFNYQIGNIP